MWQDSSSYASHCLSRIDQINRRPGSSRRFLGIIGVNVREAEGFYMDLIDHQIGIYLVPGLTFRFTSWSRNSQLQGIA
jgi:hypothetical protein